MGTTPRFGIPYPEASEPNNVPLDILEAVTKIDTDAAIDMQGLFAARPAAGKTGRYYWATDYQLLYRDDGSQWREIIRSIAWTTWTPQAKCEDGGGNTINTLNFSSPGLFEPVDCRYRLINGGTQCEFILRAKIVVNGTFTPPGTQFGLVMSLPVKSIQDSTLGSAQAFNNSVRWRVAVPYASAFGTEVGLVSIYPLNNEPAFPIGGGFTWTHINGIYEVAVPGSGITGDPPPEEVGGDWPHGAVSGDLEGAWPNFTLKDAAVADRSISVFAAPTAHLPMNNKKHTGQAKGTTATDGATLQNILDHEDAVDPHPQYASGNVILSETEPISPTLNDVWIRPL